MGRKHGALLPAVDVAKMLTCQIDTIVGLIEQIIFRAWTLQPSQWKCQVPLPVILTVIPATGFPGGVTVITSACVR